MELSETAVNQNDIGVEFVPGAGFAIATADNLANRRLVVVADASNSVPPVGLFEWPAVNEAHL